MITLRWHFEKNAYHILFHSPRHIMRIPHFGHNSTGTPGACGGETEP